MYRYRRIEKDADDAARFQNNMTEPADEVRCISTNIEIVVEAVGRIHDEFCTDITIAVETVTISL